MNKIIKLPNYKYLGVTAGTLDGLLQIPESYSWRNKLINSISDQRRQWPLLWHFYSSINAAGYDNENDYLNDSFAAVAVPYKYSKKDSLIKLPKAAIFNGDFVMRRHLWTVLQETTIQDKLMKKGVFCATQQCLTGVSQAGPFPWGLGLPANSYKHIADVGAYEGSFNTTLPIYETKYWKGGELLTLCFINLNISQNSWYCIDNNVDKAQLLANRLANGPKLTYQQAVSPREEALNYAASLQEIILPIFDRLKCLVCYWDLPDFVVPISNQTYIAPNPPGSGIIGPTIAIEYWLEGYTITNDEIKTLVMETCDSAGDSCEFLEMGFFNISDYDSYANVLINKIKEFYNVE